MSGENPDHFVYCASSSNGFGGTKMWIFPYFQFRFPTVLPFLDSLYLHQDDKLLFKLIICKLLCISAPNNRPDSLD